MKSCTWLTVKTSLPISLVTSLSLPHATISEDIFQSLVFYHSLLLLKQTTAGRSTLSTSNFFCMPAHRLFHSSCRSLLLPFLLCVHCPIPAETSLSPHPSLQLSLTLAVSKLPFRRACICNSINCRNPRDRASEFCSRAIRGWSPSCSPWWQRVVQYYATYLELIIRSQVTRCLPCNGIFTDNFQSEHGIQPQDGFPQSRL
jgi:hypothetical protein